MKKWTKIGTRRVAVQVAQAWSFGFGKEMSKVYGVSIDDTLVFRDAKKTDYYADKSQHKEYVEGLLKLLEDAEFLRYSHKKAQAKLEEILKATRQQFDRDLSKLTNEELHDIYHDFVVPGQTQFYIRMWMVFTIGAPLAEVMQRELEKRARAEDVVKHLTVLASPLKPNDVINERMDLLKLAIQRKELGEKSFAENLKQHVNEYQHIPMFDFDHEPYSEKHFLAELDDVSNPKKELGEMEKQRINIEKDFNKAVDTLKPDKKFQRLIDFLQENVWLRDYRDKVRQKLNLELRKFYLVVADRLGLSIDEVASLTNDEIIEHLQRGEEFLREEVERRKKSYLFIQRGDAVKIFSGDEALKRAQKELELGDQKKIRVIRGIVGSKGHATGVVKIVYTNRDLGKVKKGDVIVAPMIRQDFVPAMRKAIAIVTNEGSVTCHAAIVARELKKPCVVATKIATEQLADGDMVEVDANKGIVKKLVS